MLQVALEKNGPVLYIEIFSVVSWIKYLFGRRPFSVLPSLSAYPAKTLQVNFTVKRS